MLYIILKRWLYQYYWYFTYLSGKIIRNIEKSEYDVTVTSSLGVASQNWVWGFFVRRWSLCVNFMTLALLVPEIQRGSRACIKHFSFLWISEDLWTTNACSNNHFLPLPFTTKAFKTPVSRHFLRLVRHADVAWIIPALRSERSWSWGLQLWTDS